MVSETVVGETAAPRVARKGIWGWMLFDWAAQPFHTLIITFVFAPYFATFVAPSAVKGQEWWGYAAAIGGVLVALLSPILGAISDATGPRKPWIFGFSVLAVLGSGALWFVTPDANTGMVLFSLAAFVVALIGFEFSAVFNNAMMPGLVTRERLGALSGNAWALGYVGGLISLVVILLTMATNPETGKTLIGIDPILGLNAATQDGDRASGPWTALWYLIFIIPLFLFTPDAFRKERSQGAVKRSLRELGHTIRSLPSHPGLLFFLLASMFYRDALNGLYTFGGIYARGVLGWSTIQLGIFGILASVAGVFGCMVGGWADNRAGTKRIVITCILVLAVACALIISTSPTEIFFMTVAADSGLPNNIFYGAGCLIGAAGGALQAASRPLLVDQANPDKMGEAFGLYALSGKATAFLAPLSIAIVTGFSESQRIGMAPILILFLIGLLLLIPVRSRT